MIVITIKATTDSDRALLGLLRDHLCYAITDEFGIKMKAKGWTGHSGGDDAYFGLHGKTVKVEINEN